MTTVERVGEARAATQSATDLKRAAVAVFGVVAAWTVEGFRGNSAPGPNLRRRVRQLRLHPPEDSTAAGWIRRFALARPAPAAATTTSRIATPAPAGAAPPVAYDGGESGYYQCCDCNCYGQLCACRVHLDRLQRTRTGGSHRGRSARTASGYHAWLPPGFGDDAPQLPPGVPSCFPFCD